MAFIPFNQRSWGRQPNRQQPAPAALPPNSVQQQQPQQPVVPFDAGLTNAYNTADLNYGNSLAAIAQQQPIIQRQYGYDDQGGIDPNNPFSKAQLLQRAYQQTKAGTGNQMAARGQLYSGALQRGQNENQFNYQAQDAQLRGQYSQQLAELARLRADAANTRNNSKSGAYWDWVMGELERRNAPPAPVDQAPYDPAMDPAMAPAPGAPDGGIPAMFGGDIGPYNIPVAPNSPRGVKVTAGASGLGGLFGRMYRGRR